MNKIILPVALAILALCSCSKEDSSTPNPGSTTGPDSSTGPLTRVDTLTTGKWRLTAFFDARTYEDGSKDTFSFYGPCIADDLFTLYADSTMLKDEGAVKCVASNPQTSTGTWELRDNGTKFYESMILGAAADIVQFDNDTMALSFPILVGNIHHHHVLTYEHIY